MKGVIMPANINYEGKPADIQKFGEMRFCFDDWRPTEFNESTDCTFALYCNKDDELMSIETYYYMCKQFAAAIGFGEKTINEWFGEY